MLRNLSSVAGMAELTREQLFDIELRRLALEEQREANRAREADGEGQTNHLNVVYVSVVSAFVGAVASLGGAYFTGAFSVQEAEVSQRGQFDLAQQQFANDLINEALSEGSDRERAARLLFMVDVGLFDNALKPDKIREYAAAEVERVDSGTQGDSLLPRGLSGQAEPVAFFFEGGAPLLDVFQNADSIEVLKQYGALETREGLALMLATLHWETGGFKVVAENLNYSGSALRRVFPKDFSTDEEASAFARNPEAIANRIYAKRLGNGPEESGDGWRYRGRGYIQIVGRSNYERIGTQIGMDLVGSPDLAASPSIALEIALIFLSTRTRGGKNLIELAHENDAANFRRGVTGGTHGLQPILALQKQYMAAFSEDTLRDHPLVVALPASE